MSSAPSERPSCPHCGEPVGAYEPLWRVTPHIGAELTSWLQIKEMLGAHDSLWHAVCAEADGVPGG